MANRIIRCVFEHVGDVHEAEELVHLAIIAAGGLHSESRLKMAARYRSSEASKTLEIDTSTPEGESVGQIFIALADRALDPAVYSLQMILQDVVGSGPVVRGVVKTAS